MCITTVWSQDIETGGSLRLRDHTPRGKNGKARVQANKEAITELKPLCFDKAMDFQGLQDQSTSRKVERHLHT